MLVAEPLGADYYLPKWWRDRALGGLWNSLFTLKVDNARKYDAVLQVVFAKTVKTANSVGFYVVSVAKLVGNVEIHFSEYLKSEA